MEIKRIRVEVKRTVKLIDFNSILILPSLAVDVELGHGRRSFFGAYGAVAPFGPGVDEHFNVRRALLTRTWWRGESDFEAVVCQILEESKSVGEHGDWEGNLF